MSFSGPEPALGVSRRDTQKRLSRWLVNQQWTRWRGHGDTQRQARELISGPSLGAKAKFLSFNRTQSRPSYWTQHPEETSSPTKAAGQSIVHEVWSERGNLGPHSL
jgi:hypothetical protein